MKTFRHPLTTPHVVKLFKWLNHESAYPELETPESVQNARHDLAILRDAGILRAAGIRWTNPALTAVKSRWIQAGYTEVTLILGAVGNNRLVALTQLCRPEPYERVLFDDDGVQWFYDPETKTVAKEITPDEL